MKMNFKVLDKNCPEDKREEILSLCDQALRLYKNNAHDDAVNLITNAAGLTPFIQNDHYLQALCYQKSDEIRKGIRAVVMELIAQPNHPEADSLLDELDTQRQGIFDDVIFEERSPPDTWPSISLCMVVKNEEIDLAACLDSVGDFVSEIILVDTGSTDQTVEIARSFGAKIKHFEWGDDFSAARNESIKNAVGDWIFILDPDERIKPLDLIRLKHAVASNRADVYLCFSINPGMLEEDYQQVIRLFRNGAGLKFESALHHTVIPSAVEAGLRIAYTNIATQHYGYKLDGGASP